jgi:hypothetical protein
MSRRRYISTDISRDRKVNELSDYAALLYTWMIPHAEDDGSLVSDPDEIGWTVIPGRKPRTERISEAISEMLDANLLYAVDGKLYFPSESFYKYQTYVPAAKRRDHDCNTEEGRESPETTSSPSPSIQLGRYNPIVETSKFVKNAHAIFTYWQTVMGMPRAKFLPERKFKIEARLREGFTPEDIMRAIDGCAVSPWHMGENPNSKKYNDITLICRNGTKLEFFMSRDKPPTAAEVMCKKYNL